MYLNLTPRLIRFTNGAHGKPMLADELNDRKIRFNVAHSDDITLLGFSRLGEIGLDVEQIRTDFDPEPIARRYFSVAELTGLAENTFPKRYEKFYELWTRKEALLKASGKGLSALDDATARFRSRFPGAMANSDANDDHKFTVQSLCVDPGYAAAVAHQGTTSRLVRWDCVAELLEMLTAA